MTEKILYLSRADRHGTGSHGTWPRMPINQLRQNSERKSTAKDVGTSLMALPSLILPFLILLATLFLQTVAAEDGAALHEENCIACHAAMTGGEGAVLYTRDDHVVKTSDALTKQVNRCQSSLGLGWSNDQINSVQQYLNQSFYNF